MRLAGSIAAALASGLGGALFSPALADAPAAAAPSARPAVVSRAWPGARSQRGEARYALLYGVDQMQVRWTASGASLEFRYRVLDPHKAVVLQDRRVKPVLIDEATGTRLTVPNMEKIGELRQTAEPEAGHEYWMIFTNAGRVVKPGNRVDIAVGSFHAWGLIVE